MPDLKPSHLHWKRVCGICNKTINWCSCQGVSADSGSFKILYGMCDKCGTMDQKSIPELSYEASKHGYYFNENKELKIKSDAPMITKEYLCKIGNAFIYAVDEDEIHAKWTTDFDEGGNWKVYKFIPKNEIWISITLNPLDRGYTVMHEFVESAVYDQFGNYADAHATAVKLNDFMCNNTGATDEGFVSMFAK